MPRNSREPTLARQWELLKLIPRHRPGMTARELCERLKQAGHGVTKRTVERDLPELSIVFPLECNDVSMPYGWYWKADASFDIPGIALAEAVSLGLLEDLLRQLVPPSFVTALEGRFNAASDKLRSLPQNPYTKWTDLVRYVQPGLPFLPPAIKPGVLQTVQEALLGRRQLRTVYLSAGASAPKERILHPLALSRRFTLRMFSALAACALLGCDGSKPGGGSAAPPVLPAPAPGCVRVVSWNLEWFPGRSSRWKRGCFLGPVIRAGGRQNIRPAEGGDFRWTATTRRTQSISGAS